jgi:hypothetical protein
LQANSSVSLVSSVLGPQLCRGRKPRVETLHEVVVQNPVQNPDCVRCAGLGCSCDSEPRQRALSLRVLVTLQMRIQVCSGSSGANGGGRRMLDWTHCSAQDADRALQQIGEQRKAWILCDSKDVEVVTGDDWVRAPD